MTAPEIILNIAVNLGRLSRWASQGNIDRIKQFLGETDQYLQSLEAAPRNKQFEPTFDNFKRQFQHLKENQQYDDEWAEIALTWANILTHRAKLARPDGELSAKRA